MSGLHLGLRTLSSEHFNRTPLEALVPLEARERLLALGASRRAEDGAALAVLADEVAVGLGVISSSGEIMVSVAPGFDKKGIGKWVAKKLVTRARLAWHACSRPPGP
jgi:GNAT superfamily N-acetyltransferase